MKFYIRKIILERTYNFFNYLFNLKCHRIIPNNKKKKLGIFKNILKNSKVKHIHFENLRTKCIYFLKLED